MAQGTSDDGGGHSGGRAIVGGGALSHNCGFKRKHDRGGLDRGNCEPTRGHGGSLSDKITVYLHKDNCQEVQQGEAPRRNDDCSNDCGADSGNYKGIGHDVLQGVCGTTTHGGGSEDITPTHSSALNPTIEDKFDKVKSQKKWDINRVTRVARINGHNKSSVSQGWWMSVLICLHITLTGVKGTSTDSATFWDDVQVSNMTNTSSLVARQVKLPLSGQSTIWLCSAALAVLIILALCCFFVANLNKVTKAKDTKRKRTKRPKTVQTTPQETTTTTGTSTTKKAPKTRNNSNSRTPQKSTQAVPRSPKCLDLTAKTNNNQYAELKQNLDEIKQFLDSDDAMPQKLEIKRAFVKLQRTISILNQLKNLASFVAPQQFQQTETQVREMKRTFTARVKEIKEKVESSESGLATQDPVDNNDERKALEDSKAEQITNSPSLEISDNFSDTVTAAWLERLKSSLEEL